MVKIHRVPHNKLPPIPLITVLNRVLRILSLATHNFDGIPKEHLHYKVFVTYIPTNIKTTVELFEKSTRVGTGDVSLKEHEATPVRCEKNTTYILPSGKVTVLVSIELSTSPGKKVSEDRKNNALIEVTE